MAALRQISKLLSKTSVNKDISYHRTHITNIRFLSYISKEYDRNNDPAPYFFNKEIQSILLKLTRVDLHKIFCKRTVGKLEEPKFEFLTDQQLKEKLNDIEKQALKLLQFPPALSVRKAKNKVFSSDPALIGYSTSKFVFTDITFGLKDAERLMVVRDPEGTLREADWKERDRINQVYFPKEYRQIKIPHLFKDNHFDDILNRKEYEFILNLACQQFEPDDPEYQRIVSITYQHINDNNEFEKLRSTRHFGSLAFFLVWMKELDNLLLDIIESCHLDEAKILINLYGKLHKVQFNSTGTIELIEEFIKNYSTKRAVLELSLQASRDFLKQKEEVEQGIKKAHGETL